MIIETQIDNPKIIVRIFIASGKAFLAKTKLVKKDKRMAKGNIKPFKTPPNVKKNVDMRSVKKGMLSRVEPKRKANCFVIATIKIKFIF